jgi:hypothetical protein
MKFSLIASGLLSLLSLHAATPKGDYVLLDQGVAANQNFAVLGLLTLDGAGNISGVEVFSSAGLSLTAKVTGTYTMISASSGTLTVSVGDTDDSESAAVTQNYRFLISAQGGLHAIRTDNGVLSVSTFLPAQAMPALATLTLNELNRNFALLAQLALDGNGAVSGSATARTASAGSSATMRGSYTVPASGLGTLTLNLITVDDDGNEQTATQTYRTAATSEGIKAIRLDPGIVSVADLVVQ